MKMCERQKTNIFNVGFISVIIIMCCSVFIVVVGAAKPSLDDERECPSVKPRQDFDIFGILGPWYIMEYYSSGEEALTYECMRAMFQLSASRMDMWMDFNYTYADDPDRDRLEGNITWQIPNPMQPAHWIHAEDHYEGIYNTYVLDSDFKKGWALLLHCAKKIKSPKYLSSFIMSRKPQLEPKVINYLREKTAKYGIQLEYMFDVKQNKCQQVNRLSPKFREKYVTENIIQT